MAFCCHCSASCIPGDLQVVLFYCSAFCNTCGLENLSSVSVIISSNYASNNDVSFLCEERKKSKVTINLAYIFIVCNGRLIETKYICSKPEPLFLGVIYVEVCVLRVSFKMFMIPLKKLC